METYCSSEGLDLAQVFFVSKHASNLDGEGTLEQHGLEDGSIILALDLCQVSGDGVAAIIHKFRKS